MRLGRDCSVRARLTLVAGAVTAVACACVSLLVLAGTRNVALNQRLHEVLLVDLNVTRLIRLGALPRLLPPQKDVIVQVLDEHGRVVSATQEAAGRAPVVKFAPAVGQIEIHKILCNVPVPGYQDTCMLVTAARVYRPEGDWFIEAAAPVIPWYVDLRLVGMLLGGSVLLVAATAFGTYRIVRRSLAPVDTVRRELAEITASDLSRRVTPSPHHDEIGNLAETVNQTLDRLQEAVERQRRFASDAGHDLRSPITAMRTQVEEALMHPEDTDWIKMSEAQLLSLDRLQAIVTDLLVIARLDAGAKVSREYINLAELVRTEVGRRFRGKRIVLDLQPGVVVCGDRLQLVRLLTNLLDNAERHATSTITITARRGNDHAELEVIDDGEGVAPEHREIVFQRFTRLQEARERDKAGTGLGLAIARDVAEQHGGTLRIEDSPKGARFVLRMPLLAVRRPS
ncbi:sensor histidine kinase [Sphaerisporangium fuscum]|uniref:sensor histidine kinase n=1 Tax=Sphaerisporangium fuscum TaxID=2835868 RepID=UPI0027E2F99B|nr:ATP-binding protein [Sphaerisporangium fuscum]